MVLRASSAPVSAGGPSAAVREVAWLGTVRQQLNSSPPANYLIYAVHRGSLFFFW